MQNEGKKITFSRSSRFLCSCSCSSYLLSLLLLLLFAAVVVIIVVVVGCCCCCCLLLLLLLLLLLRKEKKEAHTCTHKRDYTIFFSLTLRVFRDLQRSLHFLNVKVVHLVGAIELFMCVCFGSKCPR